MWKNLNMGQRYRQLVLTAQIGFKQVAAHYAITPLFNHHKNAPQNNRQINTPMLTINVFIAMLPMS